MDKRAFRKLHGFYPHEELCQCGWRRASHTVWNTSKDFVCTGFRGAGKKGGR